MKRAAPSNNTLQQKQITSMFSERVKKARPFDKAGPAKRQKVEEEIKPAMPVAKPAPTVGAHATVQSQKRKWRLAEIIKKDKEARRLNTKAPPSFVFMPTTKPDTEAGPSDPEATVLSMAEDVSPSLPPKLPAASRQGKPRASKCVNLSGGEALIYSRDMLPKSLNLLLDILISMESAISLLRTRKTLSTVGYIRDIVQKDTHRNFTLRLLSQLAHIVPECVAVLPASEVFSRHKRSSDNLVVRLDDPDQTGATGKELATRIGKDGAVARDSALGDAAARVRRALLHKRLVEHVRTQHAAFLNENSLEDYEGETWHSDFDVEKNVEELAAPPLYPERRLKTPKRKLRSLLTVEKAEVGDDKTESEDNKSADDEADSGIPKGLLARVRTREKAKDKHEEKVEEERMSNRSLLSKLPCTMDTINNVLRTDRRSAMGWKQLITKVITVHPRKWPKEDIEQQLDVITKLASTWCKKVQLKSSCGGFAFRVVSEKEFNLARAKVIATESFSMDS